MTITESRRVQEFRTAYTNQWRKVEICAAHPSCHTCPYHAAHSCAELTDRYQIAKTYFPGWVWSQGYTMDPEEDG